MNTKFFYLVVTMMFLVACSTDDNKNITVTDVSLEPIVLTLVTGNMETLTVIIQPFDATNQAITWTSNNNEVAAVNEDGTVAAVSPGTAIITATTQDGGKTANCTVTVLPKDIAVTGVSLEPEMLTLTTGEVEALIVTVQPDDATVQTVTWSSDNEGVATVDDDGTVAAISPGTAIITATTQDGNHTATCTVVVIELAVIQSGKVDVDNRFAFSMFKEVSAMNGSNTFFSPLSLNMALGMLYNGASGNTRVEMAKVLGMGDFTQTEVNEYYRNIMQTLLNIDRLTNIGIANSIWYHHTFPVKQTFLDVNKKYFDATVHALDFNNPDAADAINNWCDEKTNGKITEIVGKPVSGQLHLINALYFKSKWVYQFDKAHTRTEDFTMAGNQKKKVNMMMQYSDLPYYTDQYLKCVELPYGNRAFSMLAILPANDSNIEQLIAYLDNEKLQKIIKNLNIRDVSLWLPRFKIGCTLPLNEPVMNTGMRLIFKGGFSNMSDSDLAVSNIRQKTYIEVNEEGTEAAAVTDIEVIGSYVPPFFFANRPFLYLIMEKSSGAILFIGRMDEPRE